MDKPSTDDENGAHLGEIAKSSFSGSGSDQTRSAMGPSWGISEDAVERILDDRQHKHQKWTPLGTKSKTFRLTSKPVDNFNLVD